MAHAAAAAMMVPDELVVRHLVLPDKLPTVIWVALSMLVLELNVKFPDPPTVVADV